MFAWFYNIIMMFVWFFKKEETPVIPLPNPKEDKEEPKLFKGYKICEDNEQIIVIYQITKSRDVEECRNHLQYVYFGKCINRVKCIFPKHAVKDSVEGVLEGLNKDVKYQSESYKPSKTTIHLYLGEGLTENKYVTADGKVRIITF